MIISRIRGGKQVEETYIAKSEMRVDVLVAGLGTAGAIAAISAAEKGLNVLAVEKMNCMGGTGTAGSVLGYYFGSKGGRFEQIDKEVKQVEKGLYTPSGGFNAEVKKYILEREALEAGVTILYETSVIGVIMEGKKVCGLQFYGPDGLQSVLSKVVIDSTGDGELCRQAGCELRGGREIDGQDQPFSNVIVTTENNRVNFTYTDSGYVDPTNAEDMSKAIIESALLKTHLRETYSDDPRLLRVSTLLGVREGNFIVSEDDITFQRFLQEDYPQPVFHAYSNLDNHSKDVALESEDQQDWTVACSLWGLNFTVPVPIGALIPKGYEGIMVAGRSLGVDHDMAGCVRMKRDMQKSGEAAAAAAYLSIRDGVSIKEVPYKEIIDLLKITGCYEEKNSVTYIQVASTQADEQNPIVQWLTDTSKIKEGLSSIKPGIAIWSAKRKGDRIVAELQEWVEETENEHLHKNTAFALALMGEDTAKPVLRKMLRERDPYIPQTSRKYNQARGYTAIYLLGKLKDVEIVPELLDILEKPQRLTLQTENHEFIVDEEELYFQYYSFSMVALSKIGDAHPQTRQRIADCFERILESDQLNLKISFKGKPIIKHDMSKKMKHVASLTLNKWQNESI